MAEEAAGAISALEAMRLPGCAALLGLLAATDGADQTGLMPAGLGGVWRAPSGLLCPLAAGAALSDLGPAALSVAMAGLLQPVLLVPFAMRLERPVAFAWAGVRIACGPDGCHVDGEPVTDTALDVKIMNASPKAPSHRPVPGPVDVDDAVLAGLGGLAHRTYVPASDASRRTGAGADISDND